MLLQKPLREGDVVTVKLASGEELVAQYVDESDSHLVVERPLVLVPNGQKIAMIPWLLSSHATKFKLRLASVLVYAPSDDGVQRNYLESVSGIALA